MKKRKLHNARLWATFTAMFCVYIVSAWYFVQSPSWCEAVFCIISALWMGVFGAVNSDCGEGE